MKAEAVRRPLGVTIIGILALIEGVLNIVRGIIALTTADAAQTGPLGGRGGTITLAVIDMLIGIGMIVVAVGVLRGNRRARLIISGIVVLSILISILVIVTAPSQWIVPTITILLGLAVLVLLWVGSGRRYFRRR